MKNVSIIVAMDEDNGIGYQNDIPWKGKAKEDMKFFKETTMGNTVIMGRKTYDSIGKPLKGRKNVVLSRDKEFCPDGVVVYRSLEEALESCKNDNVFIIGGQEVYELAIQLNLVSKIYSTIIHGSFNIDRWFPTLKSTKFKAASFRTYKKDDDNEYDLTFYTLEVLN